LTDTGYVTGFAGLSYLTLPYLRGGLTPSAETSSVGPVRNPEVPEGYHNLLEALANLKREDH